MNATDGQKILVGIDGSDGSRSALEWAVARARGVDTVQPIAAWELPWWTMTPLIVRDDGKMPVDLGRERCEHVVAEMLAHARPGFAEPLIVRGRARRVLTDHASEADLLVVGHRGRSASAGLLLGSTSSYCVTHSNTPVAVIPDVGVGHQAREKTVVGVDGSPHSVAALVWAMEQGRTGAIEVIHAWSPPAVDFLSESMIHATENRAAQTLEASIKAALRDTDARPQLLSSIVLDDPRAALARADADLLVIGARGGGLLDRLLIGSTATALTNHPVCATVVVRGERIEHRVADLSKFDELD